MKNNLLKSVRGSIRHALSLSLSLLALSFLGPSAHAAIALTPAGQALGLTLSTFASGYPNAASGEAGIGNVGPLGMAFTNSGGVLTTDKLGNLRSYALDVDNQLASAAPVIHNYGMDNATDLAQVGGKIYMTRQGLDDVVQINQDGSFNQVIVSGMDYATGMAANNVNGHLYVSSIGKKIVYEIDPVAKTKSEFVTNQDVDGVTVSADGKTLYLIGEDGVITGYDTTTKAVVFAPTLVSPFIDGAVIGRDSLAGNMFVNTRDGKIIEVNLTTKAQTTIADGGSRGDFASLDPNNNTLLFTQTDSIVRLSAASVGAVPLPAGVWAGALTGLGGLVISRRAKAKRARSTK